MKQLKNNQPQKDTCQDSVDQKPERLSELFLTLAKNADQVISLGQIIDGLGNRAFAPLLVFFSAVNLIPVLPPGSTAVLGLPLLILASQMLIGSKKAWLPKCLTKRSIKAQTFRTSLDWIVPRLKKIEKYIRPRYWPFSQKRGDRIIGIIVFIMSVSIVLPIPGGNWLPAFSITVIGLSLLERDFILFMIGSFLSLLSILLVGTILGGAGFIIKWILQFFTF